jgi:predicted secreted Zn-dependent protease
MPKFVQAAFKLLSPAAKAEWDRFIAATNVHEDGHIAGAQKYFQGFGETLLNKNVKEANNAIDTKKLLYKQDVADPYDAQTDHGATQGAVLNTKIK